jgi:hypothetical protein
MVLYVAWNPFSEKSLLSAINIAFCIQILMHTSFKQRINSYESFLFYLSENWCDNQVESWKMVAMFADSLYVIFSILWKYILRYELVLRSGGRLGWDETKATWCISHYLAYCTSPGW